MAKERKRRSKKTPLIVVILLLHAAGYYLFTRQDPLDLFGKLRAEPTSTPAPPAIDWWQVYFTNPVMVNDPGNLEGSVAEKLIDYINGAEKSIHIASFEFNLTPVARALIDAHKRGVEVRWITDDKYGLEANDKEEGHGQFKMLQDAGIEVKDDGRSALMHNNFWIFDRKITWTGSTNITRNGIFRNNNNVLIIKSPELAALYGKEFSEMWNGKHGEKAPSAVEEQHLTIDGTPVRVLFAPEDEVIKRLIPLIEQAQTHLRFMSFSFTHDALGEAVLARARAGVNTQGIFETRGSETESSELPLLYCNNVPIRQDSNPGIFHHQVFVVDEKIVITGSLDFSDTAGRSNDDNVLVVTNKEIAAKYLKEFDRRWQEAKEPNKAEMECKDKVR